MKYPILIFFYILLNTIESVAQTNPHEQKWTLSAMQIKDGLNYGLVFGGPGVHYTYVHQWDKEHQLIRYSITGGFNYMETRDIVGGNIHFIPAEVSYLMKGKSEKSMKAGPFLVAEYNYALYPDLQSGYDFWFTHMSLGGEVFMPFTISQEQFSARIKTTMIGFTSRTPEGRDEYFFDLSFGDALSDLHEDLHFNNWNAYNISSLEIQWRPKTDSRLSLSYTFHYTGYYEQPTLTMMSHALNLVIHPQPKTKSK